MQIRPAVREDFPFILRVYERARAYMKETGNPTQWGDSWPTAKRLEKDLAEGLLYAVTEGGHAVGFFAMMAGPEPTYLSIEQGAWLNDEPYLVLHRIASSGECRGVLNEILAFAESRTGNVRIDTHGNNRIMQHLLEKAGYTKCGIIHVEDGSPRIAYQKVTAPETL